MNTLSSFLRQRSASFHCIGVFLICAMAWMLCGTARAELAEKVAERMKKSTVRVVIIKGDQPRGHGSGFIISSQGHVATNKHVIADCDAATILYCEGNRVFLRPATLVCVSSTTDLAILKIDPIPSTEVVQIASTELATGQTVMTVGFPGAIEGAAWATLEGVVFNDKPGEGRITNPDVQSDFVPAVFPGAVAKIVSISGSRWVLHSAKISGGNSGGPLIDADGRVCGINTALIPAAMAGADYPISIHASELVTLARAHSIPIDVTSSKASSGGVGGGSKLLMWLLVVLAVFAVVLFLLVLRKPRMVMVDAVSKLVHSRRPDSPPHGRHPHLPASPNRSTMRLRGRDLHGLSYDLSFTEADFRRAGGRLIIGRNPDLSQLPLAHDSVSRQHTSLTLQGTVVLVEDRNSGNGTKLNGRDLAVGTAPVALQHGDRLTLGEVDLVFEVFN